MPHAIYTSQRLRQQLSAWVAVVCTGFARPDERPVRKPNLHALDYRRLDVRGLIAEVVGAAPGLWGAVQATAELSSASGAETGVWGVATGWAVGAGLVAVTGP